MLIITDINGNSEALTNAQNIEVNEEVNGDFNISFTSFLTEKDAHSYPLLQEESVVETEDNAEFRVKKLNETRNRKSGTFQHIFFDLIGHRKYDIIGGTKLIDEVFSYILNGTEWTFENVDVDNYELVANFGNDNAVALIRSACEIFKCEIKIEPNKHIKICKEIGEDNDEQFRYRHNIKTLKRTVDTTNLTTIIKGYGGNGLEVTYRSPMADIYGEIHAEPITDERITTQETMINRLQEAINDVPEISIELEVSQLGFEVGLGNKVWLIYEPLNIEFQTRVIAIKTFPFTKKSPVVTLSNKKKTFTDQLTETRIEIKENQKETRSRFEQTNEHFTMEVERVEESIAVVVVEADNIRQSVEAVEESVAAVNIRADNIVVSVQSLDSRMGNAEASISVQAGLISQKVSRDGIISAINQSPEVIELDASKINLLGITTVANTLYVGGSWQDDQYKSIEFRGEIGGARIESLANDLIRMTGFNTASIAGGRVAIESSNFDLSAVGSITWGSNTPNYAATAGNATNFGGLAPSRYLRRYGNYELGFEVTEAGNINIYRDGAYIGGITKSY